MQMTMRWFGDKFDSVKLWQIRQVPGVTGVITTLYDIPAGDLWPVERIQALKKEVEDAGLTIAGIESVNIHDDIKIGKPSRDKYIENYIQTLENLAKCDIKLVCYNFMPVFDWTRTNLAKMRPDGATVLAYDQKVVDSIDPQTFFDQTNDNSNGYVMPGWEPERLSKVKELFEAYKDVDEETLFNNLVYFLKAIQPVCEKYGIKMAIHPDDPAWPVFGLPRIITSKEKILRVMKAVDSPFNGLTFCAGSFGTNPENDLPGIIRALPGRVHFAHVRNLHHFAPGVFEEAAHLSSDGSFDLYEIVRALYETGFDGPIRPDHGRAIWGEVSMPGYGLYDRALGAEYILGLWEAVEKSEKRLGK
ncbi:MAG: mannonate dehydratase [Spirochaetes bacterium]|uniref:Mannonate dehydratase n=1 Tax=Candidatus Ornithospirochaeta stercoripullorum TaxID=2840899 RepID=A0A9D9DX64_9SPIO|nr:mannonate dehydratase [Candidatus Ornithospirochaeta stercoripullorum]